MPDLFHEGRKSIPKDNEGNGKEVVRIGLKKSDLGARKSHLADVHERAAKEFGIKHVGKST